MPENWTKGYQETNNLNEKYKLLREELTRLRDRANRKDWFDSDDVANTIREQNKEVDGHLIVFVANDFGLPRAFRPPVLDVDVQEEIRHALLKGKYERHEDLNEIRRRILDKHPATHKVIVAEYDEGNIRYHLPEGSNPTTNFLTVREMVGLVDWTTSSYQQSGMSRTYEPKSG